MLIEKFQRYADALFACLVEREQSLQPEGAITWLSMLRADELALFSFDPQVCNHTALV